MNEQIFSFDEVKLSRIFPFYLLIDEQLKIASHGTSITKLCPLIAKGNDFSQCFRIKRPFTDIITVNALEENSDQLIILEHKLKSDILLRGQIEKTPNGYLFVGSPWFVSMEDVNSKNLLLTDFAYHDPLLDMLQILRTHQATASELTEQLKINNRQKEELKKDREELNKLSVVASANRNGVVFAHPSAEIFWCNEAYTAITGFSQEEVMGRTPVEVGNTPATDMEMLGSMIDNFYRGESFDVEILHGRKNSTPFWARIKGQPIYDSKGRLLQYFAMIEDISEWKKLQSQKEELLHSLEKSNKELEDYAQIVSHDLKSPLRSINSLITWIKEDNTDNLSGETLQYFDLIDDKLEKMDHLIHGILTYSKIDRTDIAKENVNLQEVVQNTINIIDIPPHISVTIKNQLPILRADRYRMQQLFQNLIGNAVQYIDKPRGIVEIASEETDKHYVFSVKDNGPGIAKENHEKIFKIFQSLTKNEKSTGLGLSIVKKIVDNYKGEVSIESEEGAGTTFYIKLKK